MATKTTGALLKAFYNDPAYWPDGAWHEDEYITVNGTDPEHVEILTLSDSDKVSVSGGAMFDLPDGKGGRLDRSFESHFKHWLKAQTTDQLLVEFRRRSGTP